MSSTDLISLDEFTNSSSRVFSIFGLTVARKSKKPRIYQKLFGVLSLLCLVTVVSQIMLFTYVHLGQSKYFLELTFDFSCIGIGVLTYLKIFMICFIKNNVVLEVTDLLDSLFPKSQKEQEKFGTKKYLDALKIQNRSYEILMPLLIAVFAISPIIISISKYFFVGGKFERNLPYFVWFPAGVNGSDPIIFEIFYLIAALGAFSCIIVLAIDLLYCSLLTVLSMEFDILRAKFEEFSKGSREELSDLINEHYTLIK